MRPLFFLKLAALCAPLLCASAGAAPRAEPPPDARQAVVIEVETSRGDSLMPPIFLEYGESQRPQFEWVNRESPNGSALLLPAGREGASLLWHFYSFFPGSAFVRLGAPQLSPEGLRLRFAYELKARLIADYQPGAAPHFAPVRKGRLDAHRGALIDKNGDMIIGMDGAWRSPGHPELSPEATLIPLDGSRVILAQESGLLIYARHFQKAAPAVSP